jgi:hypothetical protein
MKAKIVMLILFALSGNINAMLRHPYTDAKGYRYKNENEVQDLRNIAILSYGSLVNQPVNSESGVRLEADYPFEPTNTYLPVNLMRKSLSNRVTAVIDSENGLPKRVWAVTSKFKFLPNARNNLAGREGAPYRGRDTGYSLDNIFYMKKLLPGRAKDANEKVVSGRWVIRNANDSRQDLPMDVAINLADWADENNYGAIIWASFPPNINSESELIQMLLQDDTLLANTQNYVNILPDGPQTDLEVAVVQGKAALRALSVIHN